MSAAEDTNNIIDLNTFRSGNGPTDENWLMNIEEDKIFFVREKIPVGMPHKAPSPIVSEFTIDRKFKNVVRLHQYVEDKVITVHVHALTFSRTMELVEDW